MLPVAVKVPDAAIGIDGAKTAHSVNLRKVEAPLCRTGIERILVAQNPRILRLLCPPIGEGASFCARQDRLHTRAVRIHG